MVIVILGFTSLAGPRKISPAPRPAGPAGSRATRGPLAFADSSLTSPVQKKSSTTSSSNTAAAIRTTGIESLAVFGFCQFIHASGELLPHAEILAGHGGDAADHREPLPRRQSRTRSSFARSTTKLPRHTSTQTFVMPLADGTADREPSGSSPRSEWTECASM